MTPELFGLSNAQTLLSEVVFQKQLNPDSDVPLNNAVFTLDCKCKEVFLSFQEFSYFNLNIIAISASTFTIILCFYESVPSSCLILNIYHFVRNITGEGKIVRNY